MKTLLCILILFLTGCSHEPNTDFLPGTIACLGDEEILIIRRAKYATWADVRIEGIYKYVTINAKTLRRC